MGHSNEFSMLKWSLQSQDPNPIEHLWDVLERVIRILDVQPTNVEELLDAIIRALTQISKECVQNIAESIPRSIGWFKRYKGVQPRTGRVCFIKSR